ncbi:uncharacterized protein LOC126295031 [Schistocerca gregaria]|uniref:uncharacterized protein LOC126295031 n=1 Tax=Schistocerca gregaria TaxID=7010 RepID=UPI00211DE7EA|nr:uncharacterized protein LOC126295031 [Schistocerca gregaria]
MANCVISHGPRGYAVHRSRALQAPSWVEVDVCTSDTTAQYTFNPHDGGFGSCLTEVSHPVCRALGVIAKTQKGSRNRSSQIRTSHPTLYGDSHVRAVTILYVVRNVAVHLESLASVEPREDGQWTDNEESVLRKFTHTEGGHKRGVKNFSVFRLRGQTAGAAESLPAAMLALNILCLKRRRSSSWAPAGGSPLSGSGKGILSAARGSRGGGGAAPPSCGAAANNTVAYR